MPTPNIVLEGLSYDAITEIPSTKPKVKNDNIALFGLNKTQNIPSVFYDTPDIPTLDSRYDSPYRTFSDVDDIRAESQTRGNRILSGVGRLALTTGTKLGAGLGYLGGGAAALATWDFKQLTENVVSAFFDNAEETVKNEWLPIYKTKRYEEGNLFQQMGTLSFWTDDVVDGVAFMASAYIPGMAASKLGAGLKIAGALKGVEAVEAANLYTQGAKYSEVAKLFNNGLTAAKLGKAGKEAVNLYKLANNLDIAQTTALATFMEAGFEAKDMSNQIEADLTGTINYKTGKVFTKAEIDEAKAQGALNNYWGNVAALSLSNFVEAKAFLKMFKGAKAGKSYRATGIAEDIKPLTKLQQTKTFAFDALKTGMAEGAYEENIQLALQDYELERRSKETEGTYLGNVFENMITNFTTKEGGKNIGLGFIIGMLPGGYSGVKKVKAENEHARKLQSIIHNVDNNFLGYTMDDIIQRHDSGKDKGKIMYDVNNLPKIDGAKLKDVTNKMAFVQKNLIDIAESDYLNDEVAFKNLKDQKLATWLYSYLGEEGGLENAKMKIELNAQVLADQFNEAYKMAGINKTVTKDEIAKEYNDKAETLQKIYNTTIGRDAFNTAIPNTDIGKDYKSKLQQGLYLESARQYMFGEELNKLGKPIADLQSQLATKNTIVDELNKMVTEVNSHIDTAQHLNEGLAKQAYLQYNVTPLLDQIQEYKDLNKEQLATTKKTILSSEDSSLGKLQHYNIHDTVTLKQLDTLTKSKTRLEHIIKNSEEAYTELLDKKTQIDLFKTFGTNVDTARKFKEESDAKERDGVFENMLDQITVDDKGNTIIPATVTKYGKDSNVKDYVDRINKRKSKVEKEYKDKVKTQDVVNKDIDDKLNNISSKDILTKWSYNKSMLKDTNTSFITDTWEDRDEIVWLQEGKSKFGKYNKSRNLIIEDNTNLPNGILSILMTDGQVITNKSKADAELTTLNKSNDKNTNDNNYNKSISTIIDEMSTSIDGLKKDVKRLHNITEEVDRKRVNNLKDAYIKQLTGFLTNSRLTDEVKTKAQSKLDELNNLIVTPDATTKDVIDELNRIVKRELAGQDIFPIKEYNVDESKVSELGKAQVDAIIDDIKPDFNNIESIKKVLIEISKLKDTQVKEYATNRLSLHLISSLSLYWDLQQSLSTSSADTNNPSDDNEPEEDEDTFDGFAFSFDGNSTIVYVHTFSKGKGNYQLDEQGNLIVYTEDVKLYRQLSNLKVGDRLNLQVDTSKIKDGKTFKGEDVTEDNLPIELIDGLGNKLELYLQTGTYLAFELDIINNLQFDTSGIAKINSIIERYNNKGYDGALEQLRSDLYDIFGELLGDKEEYVKYNINNEYNDAERLLTHLSKVFKFKGNIALELDKIVDNLDRWKTRIAADQKMTAAFRKEMFKNQSTSIPIKLSQMSSGDIHKSNTFKPIISVFGEQSKEGKANTINKAVLAKVSADNPNELIDVITGEHLQVLLEVPLIKGVVYYISNENFNKSNFPVMLYRRKLNKEEIATTKDLIKQLSAKIKTKGLSLSSPDIANIKTKLDNLIYNKIEKGKIFIKDKDGNDIEATSTNLSRLLKDSIRNVNYDRLSNEYVPINNESYGEKYKQEVLEKGELVTNASMVLDENNNKVGVAHPYGKYNLSIAITPTTSETTWESLTIEQKNKLMDYGIVDKESFDLIWNNMSNEERDEAINCNK